MNAARAAWRIVNAPLELAAFVAFDVSALISSAAEWTHSKAYDWESGGTNINISLTDKDPQEIADRVVEQLERQKLLGRRQKGLQKSEFVKYLDSKNTQHDE